MFNPSNLKFALEIYYLELCGSTLHTTQSEAYKKFYIHKFACRKKHYFFYARNISHRFDGNKKKGSTEGM